MRRTLVGVALALGIAAQVSAQPPRPIAPPPPPPPIVQFVDFATADAIAGWAFDRRTGAQPNHLDILDVQLDPVRCPGADCRVTRAEWIEANVWGNVARPDVAQAFQVGGYAGYGLTFQRPLASGRHYVSLFWNEYQTHTSQSVTVVIDVP
jgi:hypothetical protein